MPAFEIAELRFFHSDSARVMLEYASSPEVPHHVRLLQMGNDTHTSAYANSRALTVRGKTGPEFAATAR